MPQRPGSAIHLESSRWFSVATSFCFLHLSKLFARDDTSLTSRVRCLAMLNRIVLKIGTFFPAVILGIERWYGSARMRIESYNIDVIGPLGSRRWTSALNAVLI